MLYSHGTFIILFLFFIFAQLALNLLFQRFYLSFCIKKKIKKKIKIEINHAGNQQIPEFYDSHGNKKSITFEIYEDSTILDVKDEIAKRVKYSDRTISLFKRPFGKKLLNTTNIICFHNTDPLYLYIVIPDY